MQQRHTDDIRIQDPKRILSQHIKNQKKNTAEFENYICFGNKLSRYAEQCSVEILIYGRGEELNHKIETPSLYHLKISVLIGWFVRIRLIAKCQTYFEKSIKIENASVTTRKCTDNTIFSDEKNTTRLVRTFGSLLNTLSFDLTKDFYSKFSENKLQNK